MNRKNRIKIILFFTYGVSLKQWANAGLLEREVLLYKRLNKKGVRVTFVTYGDSTDYHYCEMLDDIHVVPFYAITKRPHLRIIKLFHSLVLPFILRKEIKQADILKTNQMWGCWVAVISKFAFNKILIIRSGYEMYRNCLRSNGPILRKTLFWLVSWLAYRFGDKIIITSNEDKQFISKSFFVSSTKINVLINYVDTAMFKRTSCKKHKNRLLFIGRLSKQKNIYNLLDAIMRTGYELDIVGDGEQKRALEYYIRKYNIKANFLGRYPNDRIPNIINRYPVFILPSHYENNPKALLEAMACESAVIGSNITGIKEVIKHNEGGMICETDSDSIKLAINKLMNDEDLQSRLGKNARCFVVDNCSLELIVNDEYRLYKQMLHNASR
jgi:glycosyltransferase involved in cell wall biosynthesis